MEPDYKAAFNILMDYWDCIPEDERHIVDQRLNLVLDDTDYERTTADEFNKGLNLDQEGVIEAVSQHNGPAPLYKIKESLKRLREQYGFGIPDKKEVWKKDPVVLKALKEEFGKSA